MTNEEDRGRASGLEKSFECLNRLVEKNASQFDTAEFRSATYEEASQQLVHLVQRAKRKLTGSNS